jgi:hypothetical protein
MLNTKQLIQELRNVGNDMRGDGEGFDMGVAHEVAGNLLENDAEIREAAQRAWPGKSIAVLQETIASYM